MNQVPVKRIYGGNQVDNFEFYAPTHVYFGRGEENQVGAYIKAYGVKKVLLHYGGQSAERSGLLGRVRASLESVGLSYVALGGVQANPTLEMVRRGIALCQAEGVDFVLAVGGGSVIDSAKAIANGAAAPEKDVWDFSMKKAVPEKTLLKGCILTLAAAGSEMSSSCVITDEESGMKRGYNSPFNRMQFAIENPELTFTVSPFQTGCGAVDITMHTLERYMSVGQETPLTDALAEAVMRENNKAGKICVEEPKNYEARATMMWASSLAHNDLTGCGRRFFMQVHQMEHEISGMYPAVAHGAGLSALWASWARYTYQNNVMRFAQLAQRVWSIALDYEHPERTALAGIQAQEDYYKSIGMPVDIRSLGVREEDLPVLAENCTFHGQRTLPGYTTLGYEDILKIYQMAYER